MVLQYKIGINSLQDVRLAYFGTKAITVQFTSLKRESD